ERVDLGGGSLGTVGVVRARTHEAPSAVARRHFSWRCLWKALLLRRNGARACDRRPRSASASGDRQDQDQRERMCELHSNRIRRGPEKFPVQGTRARKLTIEGRIRVWPVFPSREQAKIVADLATSAFADGRGCVGEPGEDRGGTAP